MRMVDPILCRVLRDLAHFELQRARGIDHSPSVPVEPREYRGGVLGRIAVASRMRRRTHAVVEDARRRWPGKIERTFVEEPVLVGQALSVQRRKERCCPFAILVDDMNSLHGRMLCRAGRGHQDRLFIPK